MFTKNKNKEILEVIFLIEKLRNTNSINAKIEILNNNKNNKVLQQVLEYTYNPHKKFKITNKTFKETKEASNYDDFLQLLNCLIENNINNNYRNEVNSFLREADEELLDLYKGMLLKDLKIGVNINTINKIWNGLINTSNTGVTIKPMLASKFDFNKPLKEDVYITEKIDGIRCLVICKQKIELYTRQGKQIEGCNELKKHIQDFLEANNMKNVVLDGELIAKNCEYKNVYKETIKRVKNKNNNKKDIQFICFDILDEKDYCLNICSFEYEHRRNFLDTLKTNEFVQILPTIYKGKDINQITKLLENYRQKGAEGLMANLSSGLYEYKRSKNILKIKVMQTIDLRVIDYIEGENKLKGKLGALVVDFKGKQVGVGSGYTDEERTLFWNNREDLLNKIIEISFFEITKDKDGKESLRFPVFLRLRDDKTKISYN